MMKEIEGGINNVSGFKTAGISCGIKKGNKKDLALIYSTEQTIAAGVFTKNRVFSPSVKLSRENILSPLTRAVIINSGNANACVGKQGHEDAKKIIQLVSNKLKISEDEVLIASTGVIGEPLPMNIIETGIPNLVNALDENGSNNAAEAILTTDTFPKTVALETEIEGIKVRIGGIAKGAGMIHPNMATMLAFFTTDAAIDKETLQELLKGSVDKSFNAITVDGDMSTNDTVIILANGTAKNQMITKNSSAAKSFSEALDVATLKLARMIIKDGEGATKFIEIHIKGAKNYDDARSVAYAIAQSSLVKTAFFAEDANWGRIIAAAGTANVLFDPDKLDLFFGTQQVIKDGAYCGKGREKEIDNVLKEKEITLTLNLNSGNAEACVLTCDLSYDYIKINAEYRS